MPTDVELPGLDVLRATLLPFHIFPSFVHLPPLLKSWQGHLVQCIEVVKALHGALGPRAFRLLLPDLLPLALATLRSERDNGPGSEGRPGSLAVMRFFAAVKVCGITWCAMVRLVKGTVHPLLAIDLPDRWSKSERGLGSRHVPS